MWVDKKTEVPVNIEAYAASGLLIKTLHYSKIMDFGDGIKRPSVLETDSPLHHGYKSVMLFSKIKKRQLDDVTFGLFSIQERLRHIGGQMRIKSIPERGTKITMIVPIG